MIGRVTGEVWGSPVDHSRSPDLHLACYTHLGIAGTYTKRLVSEDTLQAVFDENRNTLTGVSLTMPLKTGILDLVSDHRGLVTTLHAANTAISEGSHWWLANTDPVGAVAMITRLLPPTADTIVVLGAGATAKSVVAGLAHLTFSGRVQIAARSPQRAHSTMSLATELGLDAVFIDIDNPENMAPPGLVISTLPSGTVVNEALIYAATSAGAPLIDVGYHPWPTPLATAWQEAGLQAHSGLPMLMFQALAQIRCFINGDMGSPLLDEQGALQKMADAVGLESGWADPALMGQW